jgi:integrase
MPRWRAKGPKPGLGQIQPRFFLRKGGDNSTVRNSRWLFGYIDPETKTITRSGRLFRWVEKYNADEPADQQIAYIVDFTSTHLTEWRASWRGNADVTNHQRWRRIKGFFNFCRARGWIDNNPTYGISAIKVAKGNQTAIFTDKQYSQILKAIPLYAPENVPDVTRNAWRRRLMVLTGLLRWSGMAPVDAVLYNPNLVDAKGVLPYRR